MEAPGNDTRAVSTLRFPQGLRDRRASPMIFHLFRRAPPDPSIALLYGAIVAQARAPAFYQSYGVPDTVNGRFEMIVLHLVLLLQRLELPQDPARELGQGVFDRFCRDMDANLREMGVGDLYVPRKMRGLGEAFYGRQQVYAAAVALPEEAPLAAALARNVYGAAEAQAGAARLAAYARLAVGQLAAQDSAALRRGQVTFPDPAQATDDDYHVTICNGEKDDQTTAHG
jgi:cytochrome b pre-mRNA-processing protein 3